MSNDVSAAVNPARVGAAHQMATRVVFFLAGCCVSVWAPLIPFAKNRLQVSDGRLGLLLLCGGIGSVVAMPLAGALAGRYGCRRMIMISGALACCMLPLLAVAGNVPQLAAVLLLFGATCGALDTTMNIHAVLVERESGRAMMSGFHGLWSVGGIAGAGSISVMISAGATPFTASVIVAATLLLVLGSTYSSLLPIGSESKGPSFAWPHGRVVLLGCFCFVLFLAEGSVLDWSAVFQTTVRGVTAAHAGFAYVAFSAAMTICRLIGDPIVHAVGSARVVLFGCLLAATVIFTSQAHPFRAIADNGYCEFRSRWRGRIKCGARHVFRCGSSDVDAHKSGDPRDDDDGLWWEPGRAGIGWFSGESIRPVDGAGADRGDACGWSQLDLRGSIFRKCGHRQSAGKAHYFFLHPIHPTAKQEVCGYDSAMPSNISRNRREKAFNEGRRSAESPTARNPYENAKLRQLWDGGRAKQLAGELKTPIPALDHGKTRARAANQSSPAPRSPGFSASNVRRNPPGRERRPRPR